MMTLKSGSKISESKRAEWCRMESKSIPTVNTARQQKTKSNEVDWNRLGIKFFHSKSSSILQRWIEVSKNMLYPDACTLDASYLDTLALALWMPCSACHEGIDFIFNNHVSVRELGLVITFG